MKIYFAGSIRGGRGLQPLYMKITRHLEETGHTVLTDHVAQESVLEREAGLSAWEIYERDMAWLEECDVFFAEVTVPSLGVGFEVASAVNLGKPVLCIHQEGVALSAMIAGNSSENLQVKEYKDAKSMIDVVDEFLVVFKNRGTG